MKEFKDFMQTEKVDTSEEIDRLKLGKVANMLATKLGSRLTSSDIQKGEIILKFDVSKKVVIPNTLMKTLESAYGGAELSFDGRGKIYISISDSSFRK